MRNLSSRILLVVLLLFIVIGFATLPRNPLLNDDASTYALVTKNAILHNQWIAQFFTPGDLSSFYDKPPLSIWLLAIIPKVFGINELTIHIPNLIYYCLILLFTFFSLSKLSSKRIALSATLITATSLGLIVYSRTPKLDTLLTLFVLIALFSLFAFLKQEKKYYLYIFTSMLVLGFLVKTAFGIIIPGLTVLWLLVFNPMARKKLLKFVASKHLIFCSLLFILPIGAVIGSQYFVLGDFFLPYLKSLTFQAKYNVSSLGLGMHHTFIGLILITIFPWSPLFFSALKLKVFQPSNKMNLNYFCLAWFWSNALFIFFLYPPIDFRHCTAFVPPLAILAAIKLHAININKKARPSAIIWGLFFLAIFTIILIALIINPQNHQGISLQSALIPIALFVTALFIQVLLLIKPNQIKFGLTFVFVCFAYSMLFYFTLPIANTFNPDISWPALIKQYRQKGYTFYIYRPPDRTLIMSSDLAYVDFMAGPADKYFWDGAKLKQDFSKEKAIVLSDTESWQKLNLKKSKLVAEDNYSRLMSN